MYREPAPDTSKEEEARATEELAAEWRSMQTYKRAGMAGDARRAAAAMGVVFGGWFLAAGTAVVLFGALASAGGGRGGDGRLFALPVAIAIGSLALGVSIRRRS